MAEAVILLTLSKAEAETLAAVLECVGGSPKNSRRRHADAVVHALYQAGVHREDRPADIDATKIGAIYFKNDSR